ncbi:MAG: DUF5683 domain-containing protein, partial [Balneolaceae bacterium]|nr:DUF5683 domain-containing protein [Balneolaceae bacterium]
MKALFLGTFFLLIPLSGNSQDISVAMDSPIVEKNNQPETEDFLLITPVLLQDESFQASQDGNTTLKGNKFKSFFSSLVVPGTGQLQNRTWWKAGVFLAVEAASVYLFLDYRNSARAGERKFEKWANNNWSVVQYSNWLVKYHQVNNLDNPHISELRDMIDGEEATFSIQTDWDKVDLEVLRSVERNTPYITSDAQENNNFSHTLPEYGSQQYYELISKYYQYQAGWRDYNDFHDGL